MNMILLEKEDFIADDRLEFSISGRRFEHWVKVLKCRESAKFGIAGGKTGTGTLTAKEQNRAIFTFTPENLPPAPLPITVVMALPRPQTLKKSILSAVGFGVKHLVYMGTRKVEKSYWSSPLLNKENLDSEVTLALEQAVDTVRPVIEFQPDLRQFLAGRFQEIAAGRHLIIAHPPQEGGPAEFPFYPLEEEKVIILGPEGGFTPSEVGLFTAQGARTVQLGRRILKTEVALSALLGILSCDYMKPKPMI